VGKLRHHIEGGRITITRHSASSSANTISNITSGCHLMGGTIEEFTEAALKFDQCGDRILDGFLTSQNRSR